MVSLVPLDKIEHSRRIWNWKTNGSCLLRIFSTVFSLLVDLTQIVFLTRTCSYTIVVAITTHCEFNDHLHIIYLLLWSGYWDTSLGIVVSTPVPDITPSGIRNFIMRIYYLQMESSLMTVFAFFSWWKPLTLSDLHYALMASLEGIFSEFGSANRPRVVLETANFAYTEWRSWK